MLYQHLFSSTICIDWCNLRHNCNFCDCARSYSFASSQRCSRTLGHSCCSQCYTKTEILLLPSYKLPATINTVSSDVMDTYEHAERLRYFSLVSNYYEVGTATSVEKQYIWWQLTFYYKIIHIELISKWYKNINAIFKKNCTLICARITVLHLTTKCCTRCLALSNM